MSRNGMMVAALGVIVLLSGCQEGAMAPDPIVDPGPEDGEISSRQAGGSIVLATHFPSSVDIVPVSPTVGNCIPFGRSVGDEFAGFVYRDIPAFEMSVGNRIAFDLGGMNDVDIRRDIYFATANKNPSPWSGTSQGVAATGWTQVVSSSQVPANPRGNGVVGDHELVWTAEAPFSFPGGGFIVGFVSPPDIGDGSCDQILVRATSTDPSGNFYHRFWDRSVATLGVLDNGGPSDASSIGGVVIETGKTCAEKVADARAELDALSGIGARLGNAMLDAVVAGNERAIDALSRVTRFLARFGLLDGATEDFILALVDVCED